MRLAKLLLGLCLMAPMAQAEMVAAPAPRAPQPVAVNPLVAAEMHGAEGQENWHRQPDLLGFSVGRFDTLRHTNLTNRAIDFRVEYRSGLSLLPLMAPQTFSGWDETLQIRPVAGVETTSDGALYGYGGLVFDIFLTRNIFLSPSEVVGLFYRGNGKHLGSFVEFRSTIEAGYRFDNNMRISASFGHISNAGLTDHNPGTEILSANFYVPTDWIFGP